MRRLDRAMYAIFLLALLADVARARVLVSVVGEADGGLILSVAGPQAVGMTAGVAILPVRTDGFPVALTRGAGFRATFAHWASVLRGNVKASRGGQSSSPLLMAAMVCWPVGDGGPVGARASERRSVSSAIFEHIGSPAP